MAGAADSSDQVSVPQQPCEVQTYDVKIIWQRTRDFIHKKINEAISLRIKDFN
jgi:hypothetical protein